MNNCLHCWGRLALSSHSLGLQRLGSCAGDWQRTTAWTSSLSTWGPTPTAAPGEKSAGGVGQQARPLRK